MDSRSPVTNPLAAAAFTPFPAHDAYLASPWSYTTTVEVTHRLSFHGMPMGRVQENFQLDLPPYPMIPVMASVATQPTSHLKDDDLTPMNTLADDTPLDLTLLAPTSIPAPQMPVPAIATNGTSLAAVPLSIPTYASHFKAARPKKLTSLTSSDLFSYEKFQEIIENTISRASYQTPKALLAELAKVKVSEEKDIKAGKKIFVQDEKKKDPFCCSVMLDLQAKKRNIKVSLVLESALIKILDYASGQKILIISFDERNRILITPISLHSETRSLWSKPLLLELETRLKTLLQPYLDRIAKKRKPLVEMNMDLNKRARFDLPPTTAVDLPRPHRKPGKPATKGKNRSNPFTDLEFKAFIATLKDKPLAERLTDLSAHATHMVYQEDLVTSAQATWSSASPKKSPKDVRFILRNKPRQYIIFINFQIEGGKTFPLKMVIKASDVFHRQEMPGDPMSFSWINEYEEAPLFFDMRLMLDKFKDTEAKKDARTEVLLRHISKVSDPVTAGELDKKLDLRLSKTVMVHQKAKAESELLAEPSGELHTVHAHEELSGSRLMGFFYSTSHLLFSRGVTRFIDDAKFTDENDTYRIPLRVFFTLIYDKTFYQRYENELGSVFLAEGKIATAFNGELDQNAERRKTKLQRLQTFTLEEWFDALKEQATESGMLCEDKIEDLMPLLLKCSALRPFVDPAKSDQLIPGMHKVLSQFDKPTAEELKIQADYFICKSKSSSSYFYKKVKLFSQMQKHDKFKPLIAYFGLTVENFLNNPQVCAALELVGRPLGDDEQALFKRYKKYEAKMHDGQFLTNLNALAVHYCPEVGEAATRERKTEHAAQPNPFTGTGITVKRLATEVFNASKKQGGPPSEHLKQLSALFCDGIDIQEERYTKSATGKKIAEFRDCMYELLWRSYVWNIKPQSIAVAAQTVGLRPGCGGV